MASHKNPPPAVAVLGYGGLIPFAAGALAVLIPGFDGAVFGFTTYAVAILSFLGGIQWGLILVEPSPGHPLERPIVGVLAPLVAAAALFLDPLIGLSLLLVGFLALLGWECLRRTPAMPAWYLPLRIRLTGGVAVCLLIVLGRLAY